MPAHRPSGQPGESIIESPATSYVLPGWSPSQEDLDRISDAGGTIWKVSSSRVPKSSPPRVMVDGQSREVTPSEEYVGGHEIIMDEDDDGAEVEVEFDVEAIEGEEEQAKVLVLQYTHQHVFPAAMIGGMPSLLMLDWSGFYRLSPVTGDKLGAIEDVENPITLCSGHDGFAYVTDWDAVEETENLYRVDASGGFEFVMSRGSFGSAIGVDAQGIIHVFEDGIVVYKYNNLGVYIGSVSIALSYSKWAIDGAGNFYNVSDGPENYPTLEKRNQSGALVWEAIIAPDPGWSVGPPIVDSAGNTFIGRIKYIGGDDEYESFGLLISSGGSLVWGLPFTFGAPTQAPWHGAAGGNSFYFTDGVPM